MTEGKTDMAVNGSALTPQGPGTAHRLLTAEQIQGFLEQLREPFHPALVEWIVTATARGNGGKLRGQVAAYADQRAYSDRLNELFTPAGWTRDYAVQVVQNFERGQKEKAIAAKVMVTCRLTIFGLGSHCGTGEEWADDQNALTRAEAQAFKRACVCFGLGRYFYDLPRTWVDLDDRKRPVQIPQLPAWALPRRRNGGPGAQGGGAAATPQGQSDGRGTAHSRGNGIAGNGSGKGGGDGKVANGRTELLRQINDLSQQVGRGLAGDIVRNVGSVEKPEAVRENEKLTRIVERMQNAARGVARLKAATDAVGEAAHASVCRELRLPSAGLDDIPGTQILRQLVEKLEEQVRSRSTEKQQVARNARTVEPAAIASQQKPGVEFARLRSEFLTQARRVSTATGMSMGDVVARASAGAFQFGDVARLTEADRPKVEAALAALKNASK